ncbi:MAG: archaellin/type IV pilin N-terminal domain-containing protein [Nitrososphaerota archaeon]|nr:hypothetical protein [Candidatus Bathyarchaeota archaeon]MDW8049148.1 archaellin/type IV pilin N-terminal domain-containing protein [Nitrososphaerota archaeon]
MHRLFRNKRGVSPVIATLLLISIAVAASVIVYSWVTAMVTQQGQQAQVMIKIDSVQFENNTTVNVTVRNTGTVPAKIGSIYVYAANGTRVGAKNFDVEIQVGGTASFNVTINGNYTPAAGYWVRVVASTGYYAQEIFFAPSQQP